jgi:integrase
MNAVVASAADDQEVSAYLGDWLDHMAGRVRAKTLEGYRALLTHHAIPVLGATLIADVQPLQIQRLYGSLLSDGLSAGTVLNLHLVLTQAFGQAQRWGMIASNPVHGTQPPRPQRREPTVVDMATASKVIDLVQGTSLAAPVVLALSTGMRRGEILGLRWSDVEANLSVLHVRRSLQIVAGELVWAEPKTRRSRRTVELPVFAQPHLAQARNDQEQRRASSANWIEDGLVIDRGDGGPVNPGTFSGAWARFCRQHQLGRIRFHDLRHAHATLMLLQGVHPKVVSERLGHASIGITLDTYSHVLPSMQAEAVRAFDELFPASG